MRGYKFEGIFPAPSRCNKVQRKSPRELGPEQGSFILNWADGVLSDWKRWCWIRRRVPRQLSKYNPEWSINCPSIIHHFRHPTTPINYWPIYGSVRRQYNWLPVSWGRGWAAQSVPMGFCVLFQILQMLFRLFHAAEKGIAEMNSKWGLRVPFGQKSLLSRIQ